MYVAIPNTTETTRNQNKDMWLLLMIFINTIRIVKPDISLMIWSEQWAQLIKPISNIVNIILVFIKISIYIYVLIHRVAISCVNSLKKRRIRVVTGATSDQNCQ